MKEVNRVAMAKKLVSCYKSVFSSEPGRKVLTDLAKVNFIKDSTYVKGDRDEMILREGQRNVVLRLFYILKIDPEKFLEQPEEEASHVP